MQGNASTPGDPAKAPGRAVDPCWGPLYIGAMSNENSTQLSELDLNKLEFRVSELIQVCERLKEENRSLRSQHDALVNERASLIEKNEQVRARVEAMIGRLRAMERGA